MNPLISRIWDVWTNSPQEELFQVIEEMRGDYRLDDTWNHSLDIIEEAILNEDYNRALIIFDEMQPVNLLQSDYDYFVELLDAAEWDY
tara:strand:+ start:446 stop:709 length:264 start_codon:yes stop_codon:yes gene_type:complete